MSTDIFANIVHTYICLASPHETRSVVNTGSHDEDMFVFSALSLLNTGHRLHHLGPYSEKLSCEICYSTHISSSRVQKYSPGE